MTLTIHHFGYTWHMAWWQNTSRCGMVSCP